MIAGQPTYQQLAKGLTIGSRFHSAPVIRYFDAKSLQLGHVIKADGRWRLFLFAGAQDPSTPNSAIHDACKFLAEDADSPARKFTRLDEDIDCVIDVRAVFQPSHHELISETLPAFLLPRKGRYGLRDYEKVFCPDLKSGHDIFAMRSIDRGRGCMVVVRPDQYVAHVLPLDGYRELTAFFDRFMLE
jgi:phenol 2-monooxygenase